VQQIDDKLNRSRLQIQDINGRYRNMRELAAKSDTQA
jgi:hypothetical protein